MSMENLVELQGIDTKLKDLNDLLGDLPSKVEGLNQQEESIKSSLQSKRNRVKELEVELHKREVDISQLDGKVDSLKDQLFLVTNNKQYDALMKEIDHLKDKKSTSENETIEFLDEKITPKNPEAAIKKGIVMIPEDRRKQGLVFTQNTRSNISITDLKEVSKNQIINFKTEISLVKELILCILSITRIKRPFTGCIPIILAELKLAKISCAVLPQV